MALDLAVARTLFTARLLERALHEPDGWTIAVEGVHLYTVREVHADRVTFTTHAPDVVFSRMAEVGLYFHGELMDCTRMFDPTEIVWDLAIDVSVAA